MDHDLSRRLHALTSRADRAADRLLRAEFGISYSRFLLLWAVGESSSMTQRELAEVLGVTEPSVSRMVSILSGDDLVSVNAEAGVGNRRRLLLTPRGRQLADACGTMLERRFAALVAAAGVSYEQYREATSLLLGALSDQPRTAASRDADADAAGEARIA